MDLQVLVVDDSEFFANHVAEALSSHEEIRTRVTTDPSVARRIVARGAIHCVVSDYQMPEMDGVELLRSIREDGHDQPFFLVTGEGSEAIASEAIASGVTGYVRKGGEDERFQELQNRIVNAVQQRQTEQKYELLFDNTPELLAYVDRDGVIQTANPAMAAAHDAAQSALVGTSLFDLYDEAVARRRVEAGREALETGEPTRLEDTVDGEHFSAIFVPAEIPGEPPMFQFTARDVTDRVRAQQKLEATVEKLEESNERLEQFAYVASHDLKEPLRMVTSYVQLLESRYGDELDEDAREFMDFAVDGAKRMGAMIDGLLEYSRVDTDGDPMVETDLETVVDEVRDDLAVRIDDTGATVTADPLPTLVADRNQVRMLLQNLVANAIKYSESTPQIHVSAADRGDEWTLAVEDDGVGIPESQRDAVFEVFNRLDDRSDESGTGIGLAVCRKIVERHGGEIWVESTVGEGSTFFASFPKREPGEPVEDPTVTAEGAEP
ncbi:ATP-binding protein [Halobaculum sp. MBLA0143]|uniref:sensor histidine kinase n=1 Tax=Halobaculum sp. MBLA0143 TaxID=3079933 RepID=UPI003525D96D